MQVRDDLKRFLESMMSKSGKLRSLVRKLRSSYSKDVAAQQPLIFFVTNVYVVITNRFPDSNLYKYICVCMHKYMHIYIYRVYL